MNYNNTSSYALFSDPIEDSQVDPNPAQTLHIEPSISNSEWTLDDGLNRLETLTGHRLRPQQREALEELYNKKDVVLVAATGFGKTAVITGFHDLIHPSLQPITLIISPLKAIENDQSMELNSLSPDYRGFVLDGDTNTVANRHDIACGKYTHVWLSAEIALGELVDKSEGKSSRKPGGSGSKAGGNTTTRTVKRVQVQVFPDGYEDRGTFTSVLQYPAFQKRLHLVAIDELHLCAEKSWGGKFRPAMGQLYKLREQLNSRSCLFGTTATLQPVDWQQLRDRAGFRNPVQLVRADIYRRDVYFNILPSSDPYSIIKRIAYTALGQAGETDAEVEDRIPKIIIFQPETRQCAELRTRIIVWLQERLQRKVKGTTVKTSR